MRASLVYQGAGLGDVSVLDGMEVPWGGFALNSDNYAPANLGQLKLIFSFAVDSTAQNLSEYDLTGVEGNQEALYGVGTEDADGDLLADTVEDWIGLLSGSFSDAAAIEAAIEVDALGAAVQADGGAGPLIVLPDRGFYNVQQPDLWLHKL